MKIDWDTYQNLSDSERESLIIGLEIKGYFAVFPLGPDSNRDPHVETHSGKIIRIKDIERGLEKLTFGNTKQIELMNALKLLSLKGCKGSFWEAEYVPSR
ncbi:MAG: hypothetical protein AABW51_00430 [Nanoarchaeota archaeon]